MVAYSHLHSEDLPICLSSRRKARTSFEEHFLALKKFKEIHGHCKVPTRGSALGRWVTNMRSYQKKGKLSKEREEMLSNVVLSSHAISIIRSMSLSVNLIGTAIMLIDH